jgi:hypothetical protein
MVSVGNADELDADDRAARNAAATVKLSAIVPHVRRNAETGTYDGEHAIVTGQTRMGKTFLTKRIARFYPYVIIHDPKGRIVVSDYQVRVKSVDEMLDVEEDDPDTQFILYTPPKKLLFDDAEREKFCAHIFDRGNTTAIFDEIVSVGNANDFPPSMQYLYAQGAESGICLVGLTQEPIRVPSFVYTQAAHHICFFTANRSHRDKICGMMPIEPDDIAALQKTEFWYWRNDMRGPVGPCRLD